MKLLEDLRRTEAAEERERQRHKRHVKYLARLPEAESAHLWKSFNLFGVEGSDTRTLGELRNCLAELGLRGGSAAERSAVFSLCHEYLLQLRDGRGGRAE